MVVRGRQDTQTPRKSIVTTQSCGWLYTSGSDKLYRTRRKISVLAGGGTGSICDLEMIWLGDGEGEIHELRMSKDKVVGLVGVFQNEEKSQRT